MNKDYQNQDPSKSLILALIVALILVCMAGPVFVLFFEPQSHPDSQATRRANEARRVARLTAVPQSQDLTPEEEANLNPWDEGPGPNISAERVAYGVADPHDNKWAALVKKWNKEPGTTCAACGGEGPINWHHVDPWHKCKGKDEWKRYDKSNVIPLCTDPRRKCHWIFGHCGVSWSAYDPQVREHAAEHLKVVNEARERLKQE